MFTLRSLSFAFISGLSVNASILLANPFDTSRIIGDNDLVPVPASSAQLPHVQAIGRMQLGCTVTHVGKGIAITAGHCFARGNFEGIRHKLPCGDSKHSVRWGVTYDTEGYLTSQCTEIVSIELNKERDYAIFRVFPVPTSAVEISETPVEENLQISIYSHPRRRPMEWSQWCHVEGFVSKSKNHQFFYSCDTEGGSSGAAVLDSKLHMVGIHNYYSSELNRNGATLVLSSPILSILKDQPAS